MKGLKPTFSTAVSPSNGGSELSRLIDLINERYGTQFTMTDELFFEQVCEETAGDEKLRVAARANSLEKLRHAFDGALQGIFVDRTDQNAELFTKLLSDLSLKDVVTQRLRQDVYERISDDGENVTQQMTDRSNPAGRG